MTRTRVKICGLCRPEDARAAAAAGADAIGMIFHPPSRRNIDIDTARRIVAAAGPFVTTVGVFVDAAIETIDKVVSETALHLVQLHGHEPPAAVAAAAALGVRVLKVLRVDEELEGELEYWRGQRSVLGDSLAGIVLETGGQSQPGGTGAVNDFTAILRHQQEGHLAGLPPLIVAGGLAPENVGLVVRMLRPWAVDVSSGVDAEGKSGREKSPDKLRRFMEAVAGERN